MKFYQEMEKAALETVKATLLGQDITHEDSHTGETHAYRIAEVKPDRYEFRPCLVLRCFPMDPRGHVEEGETIQFVLQVGCIET